MDHRYDVFLSYRHLPQDMAVAERLQRLLENYRPPRGSGARAQKIRVFRDRSDLPVSADLGEDIVNALRASRFLVVLCSPELAESRWCMEEIRQFKALHGGATANILVVLLRGTPEEAFPPELCSDVRTVTLPSGETQQLAVEREPLAASVVAADIPGSLRLLKSEFLRIAAPILGCGYDDLYQRARRRARRRVITAAAVALVLLTAAFGLVLNAVRAGTEAAMSLRQSYALQSARELAEGDRIAALRLALQAAPAEGEMTPAAFGALFSGLYSVGHEQTLLRHSVRIADIVYTPDGSQILTTTEEGLFLWDARSGARLKQLEGTSATTMDVTFSPDGRHCALVSWEGLAIYSLPGFELEKTVPLTDQYAESVYYAADGRALFVSTAYGELLRIETESLAISAFDGYDFFLCGIGSGPLAGTSLCLREGMLCFLDADWQEIAACPTDDDLAYNATTALSETGERVLVCTDGALAVYSPTEPPVRLPRVFDYGFVAAAFLPDGRVAAACSDHVIRIYTPDLAAVTLALQGHSDLSYLLRACGAGLLLTASHDGSVKLWDTTFGTMRGELRFESALRCLAVSPDGESFAASNTNIAQVGTVASHHETLRLTLPEGEVGPGAAWFDADGNPVLEGIYAGVAYTYDIETGEIIAAQPADADEGRTLAGGNMDDARLSLGDDMRSLTLTESGAQFRFESTINALDFSPDGKRLAVATADNRIFVLHVRGETQSTFYGASYPAADIRWSPDGQILYSTAWDGTVTLREAQTGAVIAALYGMRDLYTMQAGGFYYSDMTGDSLPAFQLPELIEEMFPAQMRDDGRYLLVPAAGGVRLYEIDAAAMAEAARAITEPDV